MVTLYHAVHGHRLLRGGGLEDLPACGRPAAALRRVVPLRRGRVPREMVLHFSGRAHQPGEPLLCESCGSPVAIEWLSYDRPMYKQPVSRVSEVKARWDAAT